MELAELNPYLDALFYNIYFNNIFKFIKGLKEQENLTEVNDLKLHIIEILTDNRTCYESYPLLKVPAMNRPCYERCTIKRYHYERCAINRQLRELN